MNKDTDIKCSSSLKQRNMELLYKHSKLSKYNLSCIMGQSNVGRSKFIAS